MDKARNLLRQSSESLAGGAALRAVDEAQQALGVSVGNEALEHLALEALGSAMWSRGELHHAALVLGAADRLRERQGRSRTTALDDLARSSPGWDEGRRMSVPEVVAWLVSARDARGNPTSGWASLTPSERQVVELAVEGLTNPAIGRRLFVSPNTVKTHLLRAYRKLGVTSRGELKQVRR